MSCSLKYDLRIVTMRAIRPEITNAIHLFESIHAGMEDVYSDPHQEDPILLILSLIHI